MIDTGINPQSLAAHAGSGVPGRPRLSLLRRPRAAFTSAYRTMEATRYYVTPQSRVRRAWPAGSPPCCGARWCTRSTCRRTGPFGGAPSGDPEQQAADGGRRVGLPGQRLAPGVPVGAVLPPYPPTRAIGWSERPGRARCSRAGGARRRARRRPSTSPARGSADRGLRRRLRCRIQPGRDRPAARWPEATRTGVDGRNPDGGVEEFMQVENGFPIFEYLRRHAGGSPYARRLVCQ